MNDWLEANRRYLSAALGLVSAALERHVQGEPSARADEAMRAATAALNGTPSALNLLCSAFTLTPFERDVLLLCAGPELEHTFAARIAAAQGGYTSPTFSLALAALPGAHWSAITPTGALRRWRLVEVERAERAETLVNSPLRIDERILHFLVGANYLDERLRGYIDGAECAEELTPTQRAVAEQVAHITAGVREGAPMPILNLYGAAGARDVAAAGYALLNLAVFTLRPGALPNTPTDREALITLWEREAILTGCALLIETDDAPSPDLSAIIERLRTPFAVISRDPLPGGLRRPVVRLQVGAPTLAERAVVWKTAIGALPLDDQLPVLIAQFNLSASAIRAACDAALSEPHIARAEPEVIAARLWRACRIQARPRLNELAQRIESGAAWDDLVLPEAQKAILQEIVAHVRGRLTVYETWGFAGRGMRGLGISAMFCGPSGTGKTLAAEVLANMLELDLYRIDLSSIVSKYIGETEKNLRRVFDAAEEGGAILLFDEADALFGKRSEVKDSHDRYANIEINYLLQRIEAYNGLAILTTNMKEAIDSAFLRRIRFIVDFPFPGMAQRAEIWERIFPKDAPTEGLDIKQLARLNVTGGNIRNIALNAAFLAADAAEPIRMAHLLRAARSEYAKLEKPLTDAEIKGWG